MKTQQGKTPAGLPDAPSDGTNWITDQNIEKDNREPLPLRERIKKPAVQKWIKSEKRNRWIGNTICEVTAMEPRNVRSGYLGWDL